MLRPMPAVALTCFALLSACLWLASGCGITPPLTITQTPTQTTNVPGNAPSCSTYTPFISLGAWSAGLKPGASVTLSATA
jgi:hypothetical protein